MLDPVSDIDPDVPLKTQVPESALKGEDTLPTGFNQYESYRLGMGGASNYREITIHLDNPKTSTLFIPDPVDSNLKHFEGGDQLLHYRISDRVDTEGNKVLFVEEIQSDLHQYGKKKGYESQGGNVPDYPYKSLGFVDIAIKDVMKLAAKEGYDKVAFTDAATQINRNAKQLNYVDTLQIRRTPTVEEILESNEYKNNVQDFSYGEKPDYDELLEALKNKYEVGYSKWIIEDIGLPNTQLEYDSVPLMYESKDTLKKLLKQGQGEVVDTRIADTDKELLEKIPMSMRDTVEKNINKKNITLNFEGEFIGSGKKFLDLYQNKITSTANKLGKQYKVKPKFSTILFTSDSPDTAEDVLKRWKDWRKLGLDEMDPDKFAKIHGDYALIPNELKVISLDVTPDMKEPMAVFAKGGLVEGKDNVPYTKEDPADRVDPFTGLPYSEQMDRLGFAEGGKVNPNIFTINEELKKLGYSKEARAAKLGNIGVETGYTYDYTQQQQNGKGYGLYQLDFQKPYYDKYLKQNNLKDSIASQVKFTHEVLQGNDKVMGMNTKDRLALQEALNKSKDVSFITQMFSEKYEKPGVPHLERRIEEANKIYQLLQD